MTNKKGVEMTLNTIIAAILVLVVMVVVVGLFTGLFGKGADELRKHITGLDPCDADSDFDGDRVKNSADACVCDDKNECSSSYEGCPPNTDCEKVNE